MINKNKTTNGGRHSRIGDNFYKKVEAIIDTRLKNGKSKDRVSIEKITNLIVRHKAWDEIEKEIINATEEEVEKYGLE